MKHFTVLLLLVLIICLTACSERNRDTESSALMSEAPIDSSFDLFPPDFADEPQIEASPSATNPIVSLDNLNYKPLGESLPVTNGLTYQVRYHRDENILQLNINNTAAKYVAFDSIVVLTDELGENMYAFHVLAALNPYLGNNRIYEAAPETRFSEVKLAQVVTAYDQEAYVQALELADKTYFTYFDPMKVSMLNPHTFNGQQPKTVRSLYESIDWSRLDEQHSRFMLDALEYSSDALLDSLDMQWFVPILEELFSQMFGQLYTPDVGEILYSGGLQEELDFRISKPYSIKDTTRIETDSYIITELKYDKYTRGFTGRVTPKPGVSNTYALFDVIFLDAYQLDLDRSMSFAQIGEDGIVHLFSEQKDLSFAEYIRLREI